MLSCDTFALGKEYFTEGVPFLGKNSDRPLGEAQPLSFFPGGDHQPGEMLACTHLTIPQAAHTYTVLGSRPPCRAAGVGGLYGIRKEFLEAYAASVQMPL